MKVNTTIHVEPAFGRVVFSDGRTRGRGTQVAKFTVPDRVYGEGHLTTQLFLN